MDKPIILPGVNPTAEQLTANMDRGVRLFFDNMFSEAESTFSLARHLDAEHGLAHAAMAVMHALMTFSDGDFKMALHRLEQVRQFTQQRYWMFRMHQDKSTWTGMIFGGSVEPWTADEMTAAVVNAETQMLTGILMLLEESLTSYVQAGLSLMQGWKTYQNCHGVLSRQKPEEFSINAVGGVQFGIGAFHMMISMLPARLLKLVSFFLCEVNRNLGLEQLKASQQSGGLRSPLAALALLFFHVFLPSYHPSPHVPYHIAEAEHILHDALERFPNSSLHKWIEGRLLRLRKDHKASVEAFEAASNMQTESVRLKHLCLYEVIWCRLFVMDHTSPIPMLEKLKLENEWSKAFYAYLLGVCLLKAGKEEEAMNALEEVPSLIQRRFGGRVISVEQFAERKVKTYVRGGKSSLVLPVLEMIYLWNGISFMSREALDAAYTEVVETLNALRKVADTNPNYIGLCLLLKGVISRERGCLDETVACYEELSSIATLIDEDIYIVPHYLYEYGYLLLSQGKHEEGIEKLSRARDDYADYNFEVVLHLRIHLMLDAHNNRPQETNTSGGKK